MNVNGYVVKLKSYNNTNEYFGGIEGEYIKATKYFPLAKVFNSKKEISEMIKENAFNEHYIIIEKWIDEWNKWCEEEVIQ